MTPRLYLRYNIGGSGDDAWPANVRRVQPARGGWEGFWREQVCLDLADEPNAHGIILFNPAGFWPGFRGRMVGQPPRPLQSHFEQWSIAAAAGLSWLVDPAALARFADAVRDAGKELIVYLGSPNFAEHDPENIDWNGGPYAWRHLRPYLQAGAGIALDSTAQYGRDSLADRTISHIEGYGLPCWVEAWPSKRMPWTARHNVLVRDRYYTGGRLRNPDAADPARVEGRICRLFVSVNDGTPADVARVMGEGHDVAVTPPGRY